MNKMELWCSRCGNHEKVERSIEGVKTKSRKGWRSYGSAIYCPICTATWGERNSRALDSIQETNDWIYERMLRK